MVVDIQYWYSLGIISVVPVQSWWTDICIAQYRHYGYCDGHCIHGCGQGATFEQADYSVRQGAHRLDVIPYYADVILRRSSHSTSLNFYERSSITSAFLVVASLRSLSGFQSVSTRNSLPCYNQ